jgi:hypothetical protein
MRAVLWSLFAMLALAGLPAVRAEDAVLHVSFGGKVLAFSAADLAAMPHQDFTARDAHENKTHGYSGFPARELLARAGVPLGEQLRGPALRLLVVARARDHYAVVYSLAEFDGAFNDRTIFLVDRQDGQPLGQGAGPLRFVIPGDQRPARWARMITSLDIFPIPAE